MVCSIVLKIFAVVPLLQPIVAEQLRSTIPRQPRLVELNPSRVYSVDVTLTSFHVSNLNIDLNDSVRFWFLGENGSCNVSADVRNFTRETYVLTIGQNDVEPGVYRLVAALDGAFLWSGLYLEVLESPNVTGVSPRTVFRTGGIKLNISGTGLDAAGAPSLEARQSGSDPVVESISSEECRVASGESILCTLPKLYLNRTRTPASLSEGSKRSKRDDPAGSASLHLRFRNVKSPLDVSRHVTFTSVVPKFRSSPEPFVYSPKEQTTMSIAGLDILVGCNADDYTVQLGSETLPVDAADNFSISFRPPKKKPAGRFQFSSSPAECEVPNREAFPLVVFLGKASDPSFRFFVRCVLYEESPCNERLVVGLAAGLAVVGLLLLLLLLGLSIFCCLKRSRKRFVETAWEHNVKVTRDFQEGSKKRAELAPSVLNAFSFLQEKLRIINQKDEGTKAADKKSPEATFMDIVTGR